jgi:hypothetical protein
VADCESIETALQRVQSGELSPEEATQWLLASETRDIQQESLDSLVDRLGPPPTDILEAWSQQVRSIVATYERATGQAFPEFQLSDWLITADGRLSWQEQCYQGGDHPADAMPVISAVARFQEHFLPTDIATTPAEPLSSQRPASPTSTTAKAEPPSQTLFGPRLQRVLTAVGLLVCVAVAGVIVHQSSVSSEPIAQETRVTPDQASGIFSPGTDIKVPSTTPNSAPVATDSQTLETFESMGEADTTSLETDPLETNTLDAEKPSFSLDQFMPPIAGFAADPASAEPEGEPPVGQEMPAPESASMPEPDAVADVIGDAADEPDESPQQTRAAEVMAVQLQKLDSGEPTILSDAPRSTLQMEFPFEVALQLRGQAPWEIWDSRAEILVASITGDTNSQLTWGPEAAKSAVGNSLVHARLKADNGDTIFLRPSIEADAWPIRLEQPDVMPTWDLRHPIPPRVTRLSLELVLPKNMELGWIEPIEPEAIRRTRGLAVITPKDSETISLGVRLDIRCGTKLSVRVRYAARLDSSMPWQVVSNSMLEQAANQLNQEAVLVSNEAARLNRVAGWADATGRKLLRIKQDRNDARGEMIQSMSERVAQFQSMVAALEAEGTMQLRVWVQWPDSQQELLNVR